MELKLCWFNLGCILQQMKMKNDFRMFCFPVSITYITYSWSQNNTSYRDKTSFVKVTNLELPHKYKLTKKRTIMHDLDIIMVDSLMLSRYVICHALLLFLCICFHEVTEEKNPIKSIAYPKMRILSLITQPHVIPNPLRLAFVFGTQIKILLMKSMSFLTLHREATLLTCSRPRKVVRTSFK